MANDAMTTSTRSLSARALLAYGGFALPLSLLALPVYVQVPQLYAGQLGVPLALVGTILLAARLLDAIADPWIGHWMDKVAPAKGHAGFVLLSLPAMLGGYLALFNPPARVAEGSLLELWFAASLVLVYLGYSMAMIAHGSWGASLTQHRGERARLTSVREGFALVGVMLASALPAIAGLSVLMIAFVISLTLAALLLVRAAPRAPVRPSGERGGQAMLSPLREARFRWLLGVFAVNGIAAAVPATLFLFFASDRLQLPGQAGLFLVLYFVSAGMALPVWAKASAVIGESRAWLLAMLLSVVVFVWTAQLEAGALLPFALICVLSGAALGADLTLPPALLAGVIAAAGHSGEREGAYFGLWTFTTKMNLALAAGISLPLLSWLGYVPGQANDEGLRALVIAYALLPCLLKLAAAALLWRAPLKDV
ncbi:MAG: MFS transporter [Oxalobacteraceae bacterium]